MRGAHFLNTIGRMKPGVTVTQVDQDLKNIAGNLAKQYPNTNSRHDSAAVETRAGRADWRHARRRSLLCWARWRWCC